MNTNRSMKKPNRESKNKPFHCRERRPWRSAFARNRPMAQRPFPTELNVPLILQTLYYTRLTLAVTRSVSEGRNCCPRLLRSGLRWNVSLKDLPDRLQINNLFQACQNDHTRDPDRRAATRNIPVAYFSLLASMAVVCPP